MGGFITAFLSGIDTALGGVISGIKNVFTMITTTIQFIPEPFLQITMIFFPIITASIIYKIIRG